MAELLAFLGVIGAIVIAIRIPWLFGRRYGRKAARDSTIVTAVAMAVLPLAFLSWCEQNQCGQGALFILFFAPIMLLIGGAVVISGVMACRRFAECGKSEGPQA
jgi:quinol-cytochrome oxidoreductase complex cytochrome b subunit